MKRHMRKKNMNILYASIYKQSSAMAVNNNNTVKINKAD